jgi:hypothetical protein
MLNHINGTPYSPKKSDDIDWGYGSRNPEPLASGSLQAPGR